MPYRVKNPYNQPKGSPVLTGVRRNDNEPGKDWYEDELIPDERLSQRQIDHWTAQGVLEYVSE